jgi:hypothetical protein
VDEETKDVKATPTSEDKKAPLITGVARPQEDRKEDDDPKDE